MKSKLFITGGTIPAVIIGHPIVHSKSPQIYNELFAHYKMDNIYCAFDVKRDDFDKVIPALKRLDLFGCNITLPYKVDIIKYLDALSGEAEKIKSVNTIEIKNGKWTGHNTDWYGVYKTVEINKINKNIKTLIIGAGGATAGVIYGLKKYGLSDITIVNRTNEKALELKNRFAVKSDEYKNITDLSKNFSFIINCTTMDFNELLGNDFFKDSIYYDLKYYSKKPKAKRYIDGTSMLLYQAELAFKIWTGKDSPFSLIKKAFYRQS